MIPSDPYLHPLTLTINLDENHNTWRHSSVFNVFCADATQCASIPRGGGIVFGDKYVGMLGLIRLGEKVVYASE
jgi:hypothetical protein